MKKRIICTLIFFSFYLGSFQFLCSQQEAVPITGHVLLDYVDLFPKELLRERTAVIVSLEKKNGERPDWKAFAEEAHPYLIDAGIDAIAYYYYDDIFGGVETRRAFAKTFADRRIKNLVFLSHVRVDSEAKNADRYIAVITKFNEGPEIISHDDKAWYGIHPVYESLLRKVNNEIYKKEMRRTNFLIPDLPEFFQDVVLIQGRRFPSYLSDLKLENLAVPRFKKLDIPVNYPQNEVNQVVMEEMLAYNEKVDVWNKELEEILGRYPYKYTFVDADKNETELMRDGKAYILKSLSSSNKSLKRLLSYQQDTGETAFITMNYDPERGEIRPESIPINRTQTKYFIKHIPTGHVYLGAVWDAGDDWQKALLNHIENFKKEFNIRYPREPREPRALDQE